MAACIAGTALTFAGCQSVHASASGSCEMPGLKASGSVDLTFTDDNGAKTTVKNVPTPDAIAAINSSTALTADQKKQVIAEIQACQPK